MLTPLRYYFALRELSENQEALPSRPLSTQQEHRMEEGSLAFKISKEKDPILSRSCSLSDFTPLPKKKDSV
jgi:hypothetical protein